MRGYHIYLATLFGLAAFFLVTGIWQGLPILILVAIGYRLYWLASLSVHGATLVANFFGPDVMQVIEAARRSVDEGPVKSGFVGLLAFPTLCMLILVAVLGVRA